MACCIPIPSRQAGKTVAALAVCLSIAACEQDSPAPREAVTLQPTPAGDYRWRDAAGHLYGDDFRAAYTYDRARVTVTFAPHGAVLAGTLEAAGLKPNFAYQFKLDGLPEEDPEANERLGLTGRWWEQVWDAAPGAWSAGGNLNDKGDGTSPNPNDRTYLDRRDAPDPGSPSGRRYRYTGYRVLDGFVTDSAGGATLPFVEDASWHVLWRTDQREPAAGDGPVKTATFDPTPGPDSAYAADYPPASVTIYGEWERLPAGGIRLPPGVYRLRFLLTEESFHGVDGELSGSWAHALAAPFEFTVDD